ncbi:phage tail spike protein [Glutamicibacter arilaitensis]|uniref:phage tail spike protein n=1 Tax=Glutamicibacter arilaitensis TaxID=256701 RepID=UPI003FD32B30
MAEVRKWDSRFSWSGEIPATFPGLNPVALNRVLNFATGQYQDAINGARVWEYVSDASAGTYWGAWPGPMGDAMIVNGTNAAAEQGRVTLENFAGLWPSSGRLLVGLWAKQQYAQAFNPLLDTRATDPFVYLSTARTSGRPRQQLYSDTGALLLDAYEADPFALSTDYKFTGMLVDLDAKTSQVFTVSRPAHESWVGPVRSFTGTPNVGSSAGLDVFSLRHAGYYESGWFDEVLVAHPSASFSVTAFAEELARGTWAAGQAEAVADVLDVTDGRVAAGGSAVLETGVAPMAWSYQPSGSSAPAGATALLSSDGGSTWTSYDPLALPASFDGLMRWSVPMSAGGLFSGVTLTLPTSPAPELSPIGAAELSQGERQALPLDFTITGPRIWEIDGGGLVFGSVTDNLLTLSAGFEVGSGPVTVALVDEYGRRAVQSFTVTVEARSWGPPAPPEYPNAPLILHDDDGPQEVIADPLTAIITKEVNGEEALDFTIPANHKHAHLIENERVIEAAGDSWWVRKVTKERTGQQVRLEVYAEARFYELATAGQVDGREWKQVVAGTVMTAALAGTGWTVDVASVSTRRTYETENMNPLDLLRTVQEAHGGDLVFDNKNRRVSLVQQSGRDNGVAFFHERGLTESKRVADSTGLVTRIRPRNADGLGIEAVNGGVPYVEDFSYTAEVKEAVYNYKAGTSPLTMLDLAKAILAGRCRPKYSYEVTVSDLSSVTGAELDRFEVGDRVTVSDPEVGIEAVAQRIVKLEYNLVRPWKSALTLSAKLRETGSTSEAEDSTILDTGSQVPVFDLVPFNLLKNGRFDNGLGHWARNGVDVVPSKIGTGDYAARFTGSGERWIEQTVQPDNRDAFGFSMEVEANGPAGWVPDLLVEAVIEYEDGETETIELKF